MSTNRCLTNNELKFFLSDGLSPKEQEGFEAHLSQCRTCRRQLIRQHQDSKAEQMARAPRWLKMQVLRLPASRGVRGWHWGFGLRGKFVAALAACILLALGLTSFFLFIEPRRTREPLGTDTLRQQAEVSLSPKLLAPVEGGLVSTDRIEFRWSGANGATGYRFTLLDEKGDMIFQTDSVWERLVLSASNNRLQPGKKYFWYVGARFPDGTVIDSEPRRFMFNSK